MPVSPGDSLPVLTQTSTVLKDGCADHRVETGMHVGTHMDGPAHMLEGGKYLHEFSPEKFFGRGVVIDARGKKEIDVDLLTSPSLSYKSRGILLVCTGWGKKFLEKDYYKSYPEITPAFVEKCVELGISILGMDTPSPDRAPYHIHKILFKNEILIIENLTNLENLLKHPNFEVIALPMKLATDSAPCRVVAKIL
jgi:kynurenine formamidase